MAKRLSRCDEIKGTEMGRCPGRPNTINMEPYEERRKQEVSVRKRDVTMKAEVLVI